MRRVSLVAGFVVCVSASLQHGGGTACMVAEGFKSKCPAKQVGDILHPWYDLTLLVSFLLDSVDGPVVSSTPSQGRPENSPLDGRRVKEFGPYFKISTVGDNKFFKNRY